MIWLFVLGLFIIWACFEWLIWSLDKVTCPVCNGICGVQVSIEEDKDCQMYASDWYDCDFCNATGSVKRHKAKSHVRKKNEDAACNYPG